MVDAQASPLLCSCQRGTDCSAVCATGGHANADMGTAGVGGVPGFAFLQDNASCHTSELREEWMEVNDFVLHDHPRQSPDLNRIEESVGLLQKSGVRPQA